MVSTMFKTLRVETKEAEMIVLDYLPFSHVEDIGFIHLMKEVVPSEKMFDVMCKINSNKY